MHSYIYIYIYVYICISIYIYIFLLTNLLNCSIYQQTILHLYAYYLLSFWNKRNMSYAAQMTHMTLTHNYGSYHISSLLCNGSEQGMDRMSGYPVCDRKFKSESGRISDTFVFFKGIIGGISSFNNSIIYLRIFILFVICSETIVRKDWRISGQFNIRSIPILN